MRGPTIHDQAGIKDPLLKAIAELREQVDRIVDEQKAAFGGLLSGLVEESSLPEWSPPAAAVAAAAAPASAPPPAAEPVLAPLAPLGLVTPAPEPAPRPRRAVPPAAFDRVDEPSPTPPRPVAPAAAEPAAGASRPEDPRERLDALAKHLDRKLKQAGPASADSPAKAQE